MTSREILELSRRERRSDDKLDSVSSIMMSESESDAILAWHDHRPGPVIRVPVSSRAWHFQIQVAEPSSQIRTNPTNDVFGSEDSGSFRVTRGAADGSAAPRRATVFVFWGWMLLRMGAPADSCPIQ